MKQVFVIEYPDEMGKGWMNCWNLMTCLTNTCPNTDFKVTDVTCNSIENLYYRTAYSSKKAEEFYEKK